MYAGGCRCSAGVNEVSPEKVVGRGNAYPLSPISFACSCRWCRQPSASRQLKYCKVLFARDSDRGPRSSGTLEKNGTTCSFSGLHEDASEPDVTTRSSRVTRRYRQAVRRKCM